MSTQIAVIGLNQTGSSIGLALGAYKDKITRIAHDADVPLMKKLEKEGVFDKTHIKLPDAVRGADLVILTLPTDLLKDALKIIAAEIKPETVVMCFSIVFKATYAWAREILPAGQPFIVLQPMIHAERLKDWDDNLHNTQPGSFENCDMLVVTDYDTHSRAFQMANDLCALLKAKPYITEPLEADGIMARVEQLPKLTATALLSMMVEQPGWDDARRMTSRAFFRAASISTLYDEQEYYGISNLLNRENTTRAIDHLVASLMEIRDMIEEGDEEGLKETLKKARQGYETWIGQRLSGEWDKEKKMPELVERNMMSRLFGSKPRDKKNGQ
jgi:prephenate dehydrogenase